MSEYRTKAFLILPVMIFSILMCGCVLVPDEGIISRDGIIIYSGREILNGRTIEIVTNRVQQLRAAAPTGHKILWISSHPDFIEVNSAGEIRTGRTPNKDVQIKAVSEMDSAIQAQVTFRTKGLR